MATTKEQWWRAYESWQAECLATYNATHKEQFAAEDFDICEDGTAFCGLRQLTSVGALPRWDEAKYLAQSTLFPSAPIEPGTDAVVRWRKSDTAC